MLTSITAETGEHKTSHVAAQIEWSMDIGRRMRAKARAPLAVHGAGGDNRAPSNHERSPLVLLLQLIFGPSAAAARRRISTFPLPTLPFDLHPLLPNGACPTKYFTFTYEGNRIAFQRFRLSSFLHSWGLLLSFLHSWGLTNIDRVPRPLVVLMTLIVLMKL